MYSQQNMLRSIHFLTGLGIRRCSGLDVFELRCIIWLFSSPVKLYYCSSLLLMFEDMCKVHAIKKIHL